MTSPADEGIEAARRDAARVRKEEDISEGVEVWMDATEHDPAAYAEILGPPENGCFMVCVDPDDREDHDADGLREIMVDDVFVNVWPEGSSGYRERPR